MLTAQSLSSVVVGLNGLILKSSPSREILMTDAECILPDGTWRLHHTSSLYRWINSPLFSWQTRHQPGNHRTVMWQVIAVLGGFLSKQDSTFKILHLKMRTLYFNGEVTGYMITGTWPSESFSSYYLIMQYSWILLHFLVYVIMHRFQVFKSPLPPKKH